MNLIIAGSRTMSNYDLLKKEVDKFIQTIDKDVSADCHVISGGANGADKLGQRYAEENGLIYFTFIPEWDELGKSAGWYRNRRMAMIATHCICFWDGKSKGTKLMIDLAIDHEVILKVIRVNGNGTH